MVEGRVINKHIFVWLGAFLGGFLGLDRFMRGQVGFGILKLITCGGFGLWYTIDLCIAAYKAYAFENDNIFFKDGK